MYRFIECSVLAFLGDSVSASFLGLDIAYACKAVSLKSSIKLLLLIIQIITAELKKSIPVNIF